MALALKPHTFTIRLRTDAVSETTKEVGSVVYGPPVEISGQITPMKQGAVIETYNIELKRPHLLMADPQHVGLLPMHALIEFGDRQFSVEAPGELWNVETVTSCCACVIEELSHHANP